LLTLVILLIHHLQAILQRCDVPQAVCWWRDYLIRKEANTLVIQGSYQNHVWWCTRWTYDQTLLYTIKGLLRAWRPRIILTQIPYQCAKLSALLQQRI
jgi:hypothetical protein